MMYRIPVSRPSLGLAEETLVAETVRGGQLTYGPRTRQFERMFAEWLGVDHALMVTSGTTALHLVLAALGIGPGDEVIVPDITFVATANAVVYTGATPVLVDVDPVTWCLDSAQLQLNITSHTRAIVPVHLYGMPAAMGEINSIAKKNELYVVEDAAEGLGGYQNGRALGTLAHAGVFSFYGNKVLTTGEGGMVVTSDDKLAERVFKLRGQAVHPTRRYYHTATGFNYRPTELQAALGVAQLAKLDSMIDRRHAIFSRYDRQLAPLRQGGSYTPCGRVAGAAPWLYTIELPSNVNRDSVAAQMAVEGVETRPSFVPLHQLPMYAQSGTGRDFPMASRLGKLGLSLPTYSDMSLELVDAVCESLMRACLQEKKELIVDEP